MNETPSIERVIRENPKVELLHKAVKPMAIVHVQECFRRNVAVTVVSGRRTPEEQHRLYLKGRDSTPPHEVVDRSKVVTWLDWFGWHVFGAAYDLALVRLSTTSQSKIITWEDGDRDRDGVMDWLEVAKAAEECGMFDRKKGEIGAFWTRFPDVPHFERHRGIELADAIRRHRAGLDVLTGEKLPA